MRTPRKAYFLIFVFYTICLGIVILSFRIIRSWFPIPSITTNKVIGFAQYNGYPLFFDTAFFFAAIGLLCGIILFVKWLLKL